MPPKSKSNPNTLLTSRISLVYGIYFLYFEPIAALGGTYLCFLDPERFLAGTVPVPALTAAPVPLTPVLQMMLRNIGCLYGLFAINEGIVLRLTRERNVWYAVILSMVVADIGHLYAAYDIAPNQMFSIMSWNSDEWINYGTLMLGLCLRLAFMAGIGRK
ncbi:hypothetical protein LSUE1_G008350 [Lachnellula suecica]|uniref:DUF7704 domain-containing protein n=1 Tax=Lachnellula suecica TaxID=602035 RepID=A0A8T9BYC1_9HELO|nr:hypothetical protein LSUE1_G008350 [Lachnellula suecica]